MIFRRFPTTFRRFPKIFQNCSEYQTNVPEHFPKISEDFRGRPEDVSMIHQRIQVQFKRQTWYQWNNRYLYMWEYDIFTCEDIISFLSICYHLVYHWLLYNKRVLCYILLLLWGKQKYQATKFCYFFETNENLCKTPVGNLKAVSVLTNSTCELLLNIEWKYRHETYAMLMNVVPRSTMNANGETEN